MAMNLGQIRNGTFWQCITIIGSVRQDESAHDKIQIPKQTEYYLNHRDLWLSSAHVLEDNLLGSKSKHPAIQQYIPIAPAPPPLLPFGVILKCLITNQKVLWQKRPFQFSSRWKDKHLQICSTYVNNQVTILNWWLRKTVAHDKGVAFQSFSCTHVIYTFVDFIQLKWCLSRSFSSQWNTTAK